MTVLALSLYTEVGDVWFVMLWRQLGYYRVLGPQDAKPSQEPALCKARTKASFTACFIALGLNWFLSSVVASSTGKLDHEEQSFSSNESRTSLVF